MKTKIIITALLFFISVTAAISQTATPGVTTRQKSQHARIHQGVKSGELTPAESARLKARQAKIRHDKRVAKSDHVVTPAERARLQKEENRSSRAIARQKHDAQKK